MPSPRVERDIERLLDAASDALAENDWAIAVQRANAVLALDPGNEDAAYYLEAAGRGQGIGPPSAAPAPSAVVQASPAPAASAGIPESFVNGRYQVDSFLGEGGKKRVYLCRDTTLDRDVAFALIKAEGLDEASRQRVTREAQAMARLGDHPNLMPIFDMGQEGGVPFLVQPYMPGGSVEDLINKSDDDSLSLERSMEIAEQVLRGLQFAHENQVIHRDLKPGNIWLTADGTVRIGDFGLALSVDRSRLTQESMMIGTVSYMPPEQATGGEATPRSDLYSFGAMLYEMVTGRPPFLGDDEIAIVSQHVNTPPVSPAWHNPEVPAQLDALIMRLLAKDPAERPESANDVLTAIGEIDLTVATSHDGDEAGSLDSMAGGVFVGRQREMDFLKSEMEKALSGRGGMVTLAGEPGIGKTRVALELETYAGLRNAQVLWGRCYEDSGAPPYWPWVQAIRSYVREREPDALRSDLGSTASVIGEIVSDVRERLPEVVAPQSIDDPDSARFRLFDSIATFLKTAAARKPLILILDDLHWADKPSLLLLEFVARELASSRIFLIGTYRDGELTRRHPLSATLGELGRERLFERITLKGIARRDVARFIEIAAGVTPPSELVDSIFTQTEGNPLFVTETVRLFVQEGALTPENLASSDSWTVRVPEGVRDAIGRRLDRLSERAINVLTTAAVIGRQFTLSQLEVVVQEISEDRMLDVLDEALAARVVEELPDEVGRYQFTHALTQQALAEELSAARQVRLHARIAEALEGLYGEDADSYAPQLAHHFGQAGSVLGSDRLVHYSMIAGERALASYAHERALDYFEMALDHSADREVRGRILERRGKLRLSLFEGQSALEDFQELLGSSKEVADKPLELRALLGMGAAYYIISLENPDAGPKTRDFYEQAYELAEALGDKESKVRALMPTQWFTDYWPEYRDQAIANVNEAAALSAELGDESLILDARMATLKFADSETRLAQAEEILEELQASKDLLRLKEHYFQLMWITYGVGKFERSVEVCNSGIELAGQLGLLPVQYPTIKSFSLRDLGRLSESYESAQQEVSDDAHPFGRANRDMATCLYLAEALAFERAEKMLRDVVQQTIAVNRAWMLGLTLQSLVNVLISAGRWNAESVKEIEGYAAALGVSLLSGTRAEIALAEGRLDDALTLSEESSSMLQDQSGEKSERLNDYRDRSYVVNAELRMRVLLAVNRSQEVVDLAVEAESVARTMGFQTMLWRILASRAEAHEELGNTKSADSDRQAAADVLRLLAESISDPELRNGFVANPLVAPLLAGPAARLPHLTSGDT